MKHILISVLLLSVALCTPNCTGYCTTIMGNCINNNYQYTDMGVCMSACQAFPVGTDADTAGNTLGCRTYHSGAAGADPTTHCPHAGPSGGATCGSYCEAYCNLTAKACTAGNALSFSDYPTCFSICNTTYDQSGKTLPLDTSGATVQCKIYHATVASNSSTNAATHCPHTSQSGENVCGSWCDNYCFLANRTGCTGQNAYASASDCQAFCAEIPHGTFSDTSGNTIECRTYHWGVASTSVSAGVTHCPHGTPSGGTLCGNLCDVYCQLANSSCPGNLALYSGSTATTDCQTACSKFSTSGMPGDTAGNTVYCRIYHLGVAGQSSALASVHCPHGLTNSAVCQSTASTSSGPSSSTGSASTVVLSILGLFVVLFF